MTNIRLSMTGHRQSVRAGVPTRPRCVSRHGRVVVSRPQKLDRRSERDAMCLSVARDLCRGVEWRSRLIKLPLASGPALQAAFVGMSPIPRSRTQAPPHPQSAEGAQGGGVNWSPLRQFDCDRPDILPATDGIDAATRSPETRFGRFPVAGFGPSRCYRDSVSSRRFERGARR